MIVDMHVHNFITTKTGGDHQRSTNTDQLHVQMWNKETNGVTHLIVTRVTNVHTVIRGLNNNFIQKFINQLNVMTSNRLVIVLEELFVRLLTLKVRKFFLLLFISVNKVILYCPLSIVYWLALCYPLSFFCPNDNEIFLYIYYSLLFSC